MSKQAQLFLWFGSLMLLYYDSEDEFMCLLIFILVSLDDLSLEQVMNELTLDTHRKVEQNTFVNVVDQVVKELKVIFSQTFSTVNS